MKIEEIKKALLREKQRIIKNLLREREDEERLGNSWEEPRDLEDWADITITEEIKLKLANRELAILREVERALRRIEKGTFGLCEKCGGRIEEGRLELIPWTRHCASCAKRISS